MESHRPASDNRVGWLCSYTPMEIPLALGLLPTRMSGQGRISGATDPRIYHLLCPYVRSVFKAAAQLRPERVVFARCCDAMVRLHDLWKVCFGGKVHFLDLPKISSPEAVSYFANVLRGWAKELRDGAEPEEEELWDSITEMNRVRAFFRGLFSEVARRALPYSWVRERVRLWLEYPTEGTLKAIEEERQALHFDGKMGKGPGVILSSTMLDQGEIVSLIKEAGLVVVGDDECLGERHFHMDVEEGGDPFEALAHRYLQRWPCPRMKGIGRRLEELERILEERGAAGVVIVYLKFCDQSSFDIPLIQEKFRKKGVPLLLLENDYTSSGLGQMRTRLEAFREILHEGF